MILLLGTFGTVVLEDEDMEAVTSVLGANTLKERTVTRKTYYGKAMKAAWFNLR